MIAELVLIGLEHQRSRSTNPKVPRAQSKGHFHPSICLINYNYCIFVNFTQNLLTVAETNKQPEYKKGDKYQIPPEGSLGLLALGYRGLQMWREARDAHLENLMKEKENNKEDK